LKLGEAQYFRKDSKGVLWFQDHLVVPKNIELHRKIWMSLTARDTLSIQEPTRYIKI
jgi:hypothetical protein